MWNMQHLERSWIDNQPPHPPQQTQTHSPYYARNTYNELGLDAGSTAHQGDTQPQETLLGAWKHGSKRVRPNDYGVQNAHPESRAASTYGYPPIAPDIAAPFTDHTSNLGYRQQQSPNQHAGYSSNLMPTSGGLRHSNSFDEGPPLISRYDSIPRGVQSNLAGSNGGLQASSRVGSYSSEQQRAPYATDQNLPQQHPQRQQQQQQQQHEQPQQQQHQGESMSSSYAPSLARSSFYGAEEEYASPQAIQATALLNPFAQMNEWSVSQYPYNAGVGGAVPSQDPSGLYGKDASLHLKLQSLSILDNLASQIILALAKPSLSEIEQLTTDEENEESQAYLTRKNLFDQTRKVYSRDTPFIDAIAIQLFTPAQQEVIRKANKATFISSILEGHDVSFFDLNEYFLEIFVPVGQRLLKWQGGIFLDLKTQVYISAMMNSDGPVDTLLDELFPSDLEERITSRHPDAPSLAPSEQDFMERARSRKQYLRDEPSDTALQVLPQKYGWNDFLKEFAFCISKNVESLLNPPQRPQPSFAQSHVTGDRRPVSSGLRLASYSSNGAGRVQTATSVSEAASNETQQPAYDPFGAPIPNNAGIAAANSSASSTTNENPKPSKLAKPASTSAPRQPWKSEEEEALLAGLTEVKGPHWSQILSLYGRGGSISEVLKDRNQIQLKDKARNLKLWYLKVGNELPACLQGVTGELRKRGGARVRAQLGLNDNDGSDGGGAGKSSEGAKQSVGGAAASQIDPALSSR